MASKSNNASKLDQLVLESCPSVPAFGEFRNFSSWLSQARKEYPWISSYDYVVPSGSLVHGTAAEENSGVDLMLLRRVSGLSDVEPSLEWTRLNSFLGNPSKETRRGFEPADEIPSLGRICFIPAVASETEAGEWIAEISASGWRRTIPTAHAGALASMTEVDRCAIRVIKTWNADQAVTLEGFRLEAIAIEAFTSVTPSHIHWRIKDLLDAMIESIKKDHGHPLESWVGFAALSESERTTLIEQIDRAQGLANNAWFLMEMKTADWKSVAVLYAKILDESL